MMELEDDFTVGEVYNAKREMERLIALYISNFEQGTGLKVQGIFLHRTELVGSKGIDNLLSVESLIHL